MPKSRPKCSKVCTFLYKKLIFLRLCVCIMQGGVFITPQEAMEPTMNGAMIDYESSLRLKAVKIKLSFPQQIVEEHEHVRNAPRGSP